MMKKQFALILLLWSSFSFGQDQKLYDWEVAQGANPDTIYAISFEKLKLTEVPADLVRFTKVTHLNFSKNRLTQLPDFIKDFKELEYLDLGKNEFSTFPIQICQLSELKTLILNRNAIYSIPDCIEYAVNLELLDLYDNPISSLPESMMRLTQLKKIDFTGIRFNKEFQKKWSELLPNTELVFDAPCECMN